MHWIHTVKVQDMHQIWSQHIGKGGRLTTDNLDRSQQPKQILLVIQSLQFGLQAKGRLKADLTCYLLSDACKILTAVKCMPDVNCCQVHV